MGAHTGHVAEVHQRLREAQDLHQEQGDVAGNRQPAPFEGYGIERAPAQVHQREERACQDDRLAGEGALGIDPAGFGAVAQLQKVLVGSALPLAVRQHGAHQQGKRDKRQGAQGEPVPCHLGGQVQALRKTLPGARPLDQVAVLVHGGHGDGRRILALQQRPHPRAHRGQVVVVQMLGGVAVGGDERRGLRLAGEAPDRIADAALVEVVEPLHGRVEVHLARAIRLGQAALGDKHRQPVLRGLFKFGAQVLPVGCRIEMAGVHDVSVLVQGVSHGGHELAVVVGRSHDDDGVGVVGPDDGDDLLGILANLGPRGLAVGLVADLVDDVGVLRVFRRHLPKELHGLVYVLVGVAVVEDMPVH